MSSPFVYSNPYVLIRWRLDQVKRYCNKSHSVKASIFVGKASIFVGKASIFVDVRVRQNGN